MRCLVLSDPIWLQPASGYSKIAERLCLLFNKDGHTVAHVPIAPGIRGTSMLRGHSMTWKKTLILEGGVGGDVMSEAASLLHYYDFKADFLLTLKNVWNFRVLKDMPINWVPMIFLDHKISTDKVNEVPVRLKTAFQIIAVTRFGKRELRRAKIPSTYIPLFVDTENYKPIEAMTEKRKKQLEAKDKAEAKEAFGLPPNCFAILIMAMNRRRKMIPRMYRACKRFLENNPDAQKDTRIISWNHPLPEFFTEDGARGTILGPVVRRLGLEPHIFFPDSKLYEIGLEEWKMPLIYNASNCILCASAEGFWLPGVEAGACGIPSVVVEHAAAPEVSTGELARVVDWDVMNPLGYDQPLVDIDSMAEGIAKIYNGDPERYAKEAREYSLKYDIVTVYQKYWKPWLAKIEPILRPLIVKGGIESWAIQ